MQAEIYTEKQKERNAFVLFVDGACQVEEKNRNFLIPNKSFGIVETDTAVLYWWYWSDWSLFLFHCKMTFFSSFILIEGILVVTKSFNCYAQSCFSHDRSRKYRVVWLFWSTKTMNAGILYEHCCCWCPSLPKRYLSYLHAAECIPTTATDTLFNRNFIFI